MQSFVALLKTFEKEIVVRTGTQEEFEGQLKVCVRDFFYSSTYGAFHVECHGLGSLMGSVQPPVCAGDQAPREPTLGPLRHSAGVRLRPGDPAPSGPPLGPVRSRATGAHAHGNTERQIVDGLRTEVCGQQNQSNDPHNNQHNLNMPTTGRR